MTSVAQVGTDRIIEFQFSDGQYRLFLEFYAGGNIVLTDNDLNVISLLRVVNEEKEQLRVGLKYSLDNRQNYHGVPDLKLERVKEGLESAVANENGESADLQRRKSKKKPREALRKALSTSLNEFPPMLLDHALQIAEYDTKLPVEDVLNDSSLLEKLVVALKEAQRVIGAVVDQTICKGYIIAKPLYNEPTTILMKEKDEGEPPPQNLIYEDFHPFRPQQFEGNPGTVILEFEGFNKTVDEFFSSIESQKLESRLTEKEAHARKKLETARLDHQKRLGGLEQVQEMNVRKAQAIETNLQKVQEAISAVNGLLAQGMDWMDVARLIEMEQAKHNVVAEMIKLPLKLYENTATLLLAEATFEDDDDFEGDETDSDVSDSSEDDQASTEKPVKKATEVDKRLAVDVDLGLSPWSNARQYYDQKKFAAVKQQKTLQSSEKALKSTERKINADLQKGLKQEKEVMRPLRKAFWFEKFVYFISSEGYLVLGGKDLQQSEILYKRYLKKGDVYVHADLQGSASIIIKNKPGMADGPIPPSTLSQAGTLAVATSSAWDSKAVMSAWWVNADQVSKTDSTGDYLPPGSFTIRDQKNFLPPAQLLLGFGLMFRVSEESKARHLKHRVHDDSSSKAESSLHNENKTMDQDPQLKEVTQRPNEVNDPSPERKDGDHDQSAETSEGDGDQDGGESNTNDDSEATDNESDNEQSNPLQPNHGGRGTAQLQNQTPQVAIAQPDSVPAGLSAGESSDDETATKHEDELKDHAETHQMEGEGQPSAESGFPAKEGLPTKTEGNGRHSNPATPTLPSVANQPNKKAQQPPVRGKHGKRTKLKTKYADQDEEDRALAMRLLGSAAAQQKATQDAAAKATKEQELAAQRERRRKQHALDSAKGKEAEERRKLEFEEGAEGLDKDEVEEAEDLDAFVGAPLPGDEILQVLVVCAPWSAIGGRCRWGVKVQPGSTKKGKAVREILGKWNSITTDREKKKRPGSGEGNEAMMEEEKLRRGEGELIRTIREPEVVGMIPVGKVRVVMGASEAGSKGRGGGAASKGKRGGKGSKKQR